MRAGGHRYDVGFGVLGQVFIRRDEVVVSPRGERERTLLSALLAVRNEPVPIWKLTRWIWPEADPQANTLQALVSRLRRSLGPGRERLRHTPAGYLLQVPYGMVDDERFAELLSRARGLMAAGKPHPAREVLAQALGMWRGEPYAGTSALFAVRPMSRLREQRAEAAELLARAALESGDAATAVTLSRDLVHADRVRPAGWATLIRALDACGRRAEALETFATARQFLVEATGLEPPIELREAQWHILRDERSVTRAAGAGPGVMEPVQMIRWLAEQGEVAPALRLATRCAWGWWLIGERGRGKELIAQLLDIAGGGDRDLRARGRLWAGALGSLHPGEGAALDDGQEALESLGARWDTFDALAVVLLADRRAERGEIGCAEALLSRAVAALRSLGEDWGSALAAVTQARIDLARGDVSAAERSATWALRRMEDAGEPAGQVAALGLLGYLGETRGSYAEAASTHERALSISIYGGWPHAQCWNTVRLGSVLTLSGEHDRGQARLSEGLALAHRSEAPALVAFARLNLGLAALHRGDRIAATCHLRPALPWYRAAGSLSGVAQCAAALARATTAAGDRAELLEIAWDAAIGTRDRRSVAYVLEGAAVTAVDRQLAASLAGIAAGLRCAAGSPLPPNEQPDVSRMLAGGPDGRLDSSREFLRGHALGRGVRCVSELSAGSGTVKFRSSFA